jgi:hypothetical protein
MVYNLETYRCYPFTIMLRTYSLRRIQHMGRRTKGAAKLITSAARNLC